MALLRSKGEGRDRDKRRQTRRRLGGRRAFVRVSRERDVATVSLAAESGMGGKGVRVWGK